MNGEEVKAKVAVCSECNTKNEYLGKFKRYQKARHILDALTQYLLSIVGIFVKCYFCQCINFVGYPYFGKTFQCIKVLCPSCISYTIVPKDTKICRCSVCGLLQYTEVEIKDQEEEKKEKEKEASEDVQDNKKEEASEEYAGFLLRSSGLEENPQFRTLELIQSSASSNNLIDEKTKYVNKKMVLKELKEKWVKKKKDYIYNLDDSLDDLSDYSSNTPLLN